MLGVEALVLRFPIDDRDASRRSCSGVEVLGGSTRPLGGSTATRHAGSTTRTGSGSGGQLDP